MTQRFTSFLLLMLVCTLLAACSNTSPWRQDVPAVEARAAVQTPPPAPIPTPVMQELRVGLLLPLSGPQAQLGVSLLNAAQLAVSDMAGADMNAVNAALIPADTAGDPQATRMAATRLEAEGVHIILGPLFAQNVRALQGLTRVPVLAFSTDSSAAGGGVMLMGFLPETQTTAVLQAAKQKGLSRFALFAADTPYAQTVARAAAKQSPDLQVALYQPGGAGQAAASLAAVQPQAILIPEAGASLQISLSALSGVGLTPIRGVQYLGTGLWDDPQTAFVPQLRGALYASSDALLRRNFEQNYRDVFGAAPPRIATLAYDAAALAIVLVQQDALKGQPVTITATELTQPQGFGGIDGVFRLQSNGLIERELVTRQVGG